MIICWKTTIFSHNMNYKHLNIYTQIRKKISCQYDKTVTFNISVSQSSESETHGTSTPDLPLEIKGKISSDSYDNATWYTDFCKQDPSATSCKILQTQYLCLKVQFKHTNKYEYIWRFHIYSIYNKKTIQFKLNVSVTSPVAYISKNYTLLASSSPTTV